MNSFIKENWFKLIISVAVLIIAASAACFAIFSGQQKERADTTDSRAACSTEAKRFYDQYTKDTLNSSSYTDHWNTNLNKCFVDISTTFPSNAVKAEGTTNELFDAAEGKQYAFLQNDKTGSPWACIISKNGDIVLGQDMTPGIENCQDSEAEFNNFIKFYMEN